MLKIKDIDYFFYFLGIFLLLGAVIPSLILRGDTSAFETEQGLFLFQLLMSGVFLYSALRLFYHKHRLIFKLSISPICVFLIFCIASFTWSVEPSLTVRRVIALTGTIIFALYALIVIGKERALSVIFDVMCVVVFFSFVFAIFISTLGVHNDIFYAGLWKGVFLHKNLLGREAAIFCVLSFIFILFSNNDKRRYYFILLILSFLLVVKAGSVTGIVSTLFAIIFSYIVYLLNCSKNIRFHFLFMLIPIILAYIISDFSVDEFLAIFGRDTSFTGRDLLWESISDEVGSKPLLGFGYQAFWASIQGDAISNIVGYRVIHAHSGFYEVLLSVGYLGLLITISMYLFFAYLLFKEMFLRESKHVVIGFSVLFLMILTSISDSLAIGPNNFLFFLFVFYYFVFSKVDKADLS